MRYGLLGQRLPHSFSKEIHESLGRYAYDLIELTPEELGPFLTRRDFGGVNVTIPYKQAVIPWLDELSERARAIGAVNTIVNRGGRLYGDNTDFGGMRAMLRRAGLECAGKTVLILGTGGTSRTALAVAGASGAARVLRVSRSGNDGALTYEQADAECSDAQLLINATPVGMYPDADACPIDPARFPNLEGVADVIYNPLRTSLTLAAAERGIPAVNGLYMLVAQAMLAAEQFSGEPVPEAETERIYRRLLREKRNLVLIGMPGSGKSTVGRLLGVRTGAALIDTDAEIVKRAGKPITEIFRDDGEAAFRELESAVIRDISRTGGKVIATGGGAVLRRENVEALKRNGLLFFLDRPVSELIPTGDRPLGDTEEKLRRLNAERLPLYRAAADLILPVSGSPEHTAGEILRLLDA